MMHALTPRDNSSEDLTSMTQADSYRQNCDEDGGQTTQQKLELA